MAEPRSDSESDSDNSIYDDDDDDEPSLSDRSDVSDDQSSGNGLSEDPIMKEPASAWHNLPTTDLSLEDLMKMREKVGSKSFQNVIHTKKTIKDKTPTRLLNNLQSKNKPQEMSSKIKVSSFRKVINVPSEKTKTRDPRFDDLCGSNYDEEVFDKRFSFLQNVKDRELEILSKKLRKSKNPEQKKKLRYLMNRLKQQQQNKMKRKEDNEIVKKFIKEDKEKVAQGVKKPYFLKQSAIKKLVEEKRREKLESKYDKLEARRDKKKMSKEKRFMPKSRRTIDP